MVQQMTFDLPVKTARGRRDYFISQSNAMAVEVLEDWPNWPNHKLVLVGEKASGKTHLAQVWATDIGAKVLPASQLTEAEMPAFSQAPVVVEDVHEIAQNMPAQTALFHLHNMLQQNQIPLLLTAQSAPARWQLSLPDLQSRMSATSITTLPAPDDALLAAVLQKLFSDRQITVKKNLIEYLLKRMDRSFEAAKNLVEKLDKAALSNASPISRKLAADVLDNQP